MRSIKFAAEPRKAIRVPGEASLTALGSGIADSKVEALIHHEFFVKDNTEITDFGKNENASGLEIRGLGTEGG
jgi:hypothetical protein